jgi:surface antigen
LYVALLSKEIGIINPFDIMKNILKSKYLMLFCYALLSVNSFGQHVVTTTGLEYFFDTDPGVGMGTFISGPTTTSSIVTSNTLSVGFHTLYFRAKGTRTTTYRNTANYTQFITDPTIDVYGQTESRSFYVSSTSAVITPTITAYEYFFDTDPGPGNALALSGSTVVLPNTLTNGFHTLYIRAKNSLNQWGLTESRSFLIRDPVSVTTPTITAYEYFFNTDPGPGNGTPLTGTTIAVPTTLPEGFHNLYVRAKNSFNQWGMTETRSFLIRDPVSVITPTVTAKEYFIDTDPGVGNGIALTGTAISVPNTLTVGFHRIYVRAKNSINQWGLTEVFPFYIKEPATGAFAIDAAEYFFDTDPGAGNGTAIPITSAATQNFNPRALAMQTCLTPGTHRFYLRFRDASGQWGLHEQQTLTIERNDVELISATVTPNIPTGFPCNPSANETVTVVIKNNGVVGNTGVQVINPSMAQVQIVVSGANSGTYTLSNISTIAVGSSETLTFTGVNLSNRGNNTIVATVTVCQDAVITNNSKTINPNTNPLLIAAIAPNPLSATVCNGGTVVLTASGAGGDGSYTYRWDGLGVYNSVNAVSNYNSPIGTNIHTVSVRDGIGCLASLNQSVTINPLPTASISGTTALCKNEPNPIITFTGAGGTAPYTFTYKINGGSNQTVTTTSGNSVTVDQPTGTVGTFAYSLVSVQDANICSQNQTGSATITVYPLPTATISGTTAVCRNTATPSVIFTGAVGLAPFTFSYRLNGGAVQTISTIGTNASISLAQSTSTVGTFVYELVGVTDAHTCSSGLITGQTATITINPLPTAIVSGNTTVCQNATAPNVTFTGANGTLPYTFTYQINSGASQTVTTIGINTFANVARPTNTAGVFFYTLLSVADGNGCSQAQSSQIQITVNPEPLATISNSFAAACELQALAPVITLTGSNGIAPYTFGYKINNGSLQTITTANALTNSATVTQSTTTPGSYTYEIVSVTDANSCVKNLTGVSTIITINALPPAPSSGGNITQCASSPIQTLTALATAPSGSVVEWYDAASGGNVVSSPTLNTVGTVTYHAASKNSTTGCLSLARTGVILTINTSPTAPLSNGNITQCVSSPIQMLTASATPPVGSVVEWYDAASGGNVVSSPTLNIVGTVTYYAASKITATGCLSLTRTAVILTINALPPAPSSGDNIMQCASSPIQTLTALATAPSGSVVEWYDAVSGGNIVTNPILNAVGTVTYYAASKNSTTGCLSSTREAVTLTINEAPTAPLNNGDITQCSTSPIQTITASATAPSGSVVEWYDAASGGSVVGSPTLSTVGTVTYYAASKINATGCYSLTRTAVTLTINALPPAPSSGGDITQCATNPIQTLTASATAPSGSVIEWYDAVSGGNVVTSPTLNTVNSVTYYAASKNSTTSCLSLTRVAVTLTINPVPIPTFSIAPNVTTSCQGQAVTITAASPTTTPSVSGITYTYQWTVNGNLISGANSAVLNTTLTVLGNNSIICTAIPNSNTLCVSASANASASINVTNCDLKLAAKVILEGAYDLVPTSSGYGLMRDVLKLNNKLPTNQPYSTLTFSGTTAASSSSPSNHNGTETIDAGVLSVLGNNAIVDWVLVELRSDVNRATIVASRAALLQRDGDIVDMDGLSPVSFSGVPLGNYHVAIRHRLHLPIRTATALSFTVSSYTSPVSLNFTTNSNALTNGMKLMSDGKYALYGGDVDRSSTIISSDINQMRAILNTTLSSFNYFTRGLDVDLNGLIISSDISICRANLNKLVRLNQ